jgi:pullulanase
VAVDLGFSDVNIGASSIAVTNNGGSMDFTADADGSFTFTLDASSATPELTISSVSPTVDCSALPDSDDPIPFDIAGDGQLYVKGDHAGWNAEEAYRLN